jgi:hypothetical protein
VCYAQTNDAISYKLPSDVKIGDQFILNEPSHPKYYRSIYFTYQTVKTVYPEVDVERDGKVFLSYKFKGKSFKVSNINSGQAVLSNGTINNFAIIDLELGIKSGEIGSAEEIIPIWMINDIVRGDSVKLNQINNEFYQSVSFTPEIANVLPDSLKSTTNNISSTLNGTSFLVTRLTSSVAQLGLANIPSIAIVELKNGIESGEIEIIPNFVSSVQTDESIEKTVGWVEEEAIVLEEDVEKGDLERILGGIYGEDEAANIEFDTIRTQSIFTKLRPYLFPAIEIAGTENSSSLSFGGGVGIIYRDKLQVGGFIQVFDGDISKRIIFPNTFQLDYSYAGLFAEYQVYSQGPLRLMAGGKLGSGEAAWTLIETNEVLDTDNFLVINPRIGIDYWFTNFSILNVSIGYRVVSNLDMVDLDNGALNSLTLSATLKLGWFK